MDYKLGSLSTRMLKPLNCQYKPRGCAPRDKMGCVLPDQEVTAPSFSLVTWMADVTIVGITGWLVRNHQTQ